MSDERAAFAGQITDLPVAELLRTIHTGKKTGVARFETNLGTATVWFRDGNLVDADMGRFHMGDAVRRLVSTDAGSFAVEFKPVTRRQLIQENTLDLLEPDETEPLSRRPPLKLPSSAASGRRRPRKPKAAAGWRPTGGGQGRDGTGHAGAASPDMLRRLEALRRAGGRQRSEVLNSTGSIEQARTKAEEARKAELAKNRGTIETPQAGLEALNRLAQKASGAEARVAKPKYATPVTPPQPIELPEGFELRAPTTPTPDPEARTTIEAVANVETPSPPPEQSEGWTFKDTSLKRQADVVDENTDRTLMRVGPLPLPNATSKRPGGNRRQHALPSRIDPAEDLSDPLPIGTSWSAPVHVSAPRSQPIESDRNPSAGGEIGNGARTSADKTVVAFAPQAVPPSSPPPGATMTHGFRPLTEAEASGKVPRAANPGRLDRGGAPQQTALARTQPASGSAPRSAAQVGRYEVLLRIARGGMGTVYLCQVTGAGGFRRLFALKVIRDHLSRNDEYVRMLLQEARIASRLHHPNVVGIVDIGNLANQHYLVMDYVEGCTLSELLKVHRKTRPPHLIIPIVLDALTGLHAAHTLTEDDGSPLTLVHCDFSPQNMLVGTNGICRITDFGIARASNALPERSSITRGKPAYLAPEQITGRPFDHRADIFAAGVVLWNALTGEQLFKGDTPEEVLDKVLNMVIPPPSSVGLRPPKKLDKVVLRALERDPAQRYQSAEAMLIELRKVAIGANLLAPSSEVAQWVAETFGAQLELRRQAAGLAPGGLTGTTTREAPPQVTALARPAPGEHPHRADDSATHALVSQHSPAAAGTSQTMMLQSGNNPPAAAGRDEVLGAQARKIVLGLVVSTVAAVLAVAVIRPELLTGGVLDEGGEFVDVSGSEDDAAFDAAPPKTSPPKKPTPAAETAKAAKPGSTPQPKGPAADDSAEDQARPSTPNKRRAPRHERADSPPADSPPADAPPPDAPELPSAPSFEGF